MQTMQNKDGQKIAEPKKTVHTRTEADPRHRKQSLQTRLDADPDEDDTLLRPEQRRRQFC